MNRLDARYDVRLPVNLTVSDRSDDWQLQTTTSNIGLGGAFFSSDHSPPDGLSVRTEADLPGHGHVLLPGRVIRRENSGFAIKFENLNSESRRLLQKFIDDELLAREHCPVCHNYLGENNPQCPFCSHPVEQLAEQGIWVQQTEKLIDPHERIDLAMDRFMQDLSEIADKCPVSELEEDAYLLMTRTVIHDFFKECGLFEQAVRDKDLVRNIRQRFRRKTNSLFAKSHFMNHARTWPQGYVGDHQVIENIYRNMPLSEDIGYLLDRYFLSTALGKAVPGRKDMMRDIIEREIAKDSELKILNIGCGSCRELVELASTIKNSETRIICLDFDSAALDFSAERLATLDISNHFTLRKYNALKMINQERNTREFGQQNLIYSIGLLDYLTDDVLVRFIQAMYDLLAPHGKFIAVFKDSDRYETFDYHWLVDWDAFYQRKAPESEALIRRAGIPERNITIERDRTGVILFYTIEKNG